MSISKDDQDTRYQEKMQKRKDFHDKMLAENNGEKGLLIVHTGKGKGKSTASFGMAIRALGHGYKVAIVQFVKGPMQSAERKAFSSFGDQITVAALGEGFTWETQDKARDKAAAAEAWRVSKQFILDPDYRLVILDELNIALRYDQLELDDVLECLGKRPHDSHVVITGRNAKEAIIEAADLVTEMTLVKHPFRQGIGAQAGIEY